MLKQLGYYIKNKGYDILEYRGRYLNTQSIINYVNTSANNKFAIIIDNASFYYEEIERIFTKNIGDKKLVIIIRSVNIIWREIVIAIINRRMDFQEMIRL